MKAKKFKTPSSIEVGEYIAPKTVEIDGRHCAMCGRLLGSTEQSTMLEKLSKHAKSDQKPVEE